MNLNHVKSRVMRTGKLIGTKSCSDFRTTVRTLEAKLLADAGAGAVAEGAAEASPRVPTVWIQSTALEKARLSVYI